MKNNYTYCLMFMPSPDVIHAVHFFGIGKKKAFKILLNNHGDLQGLSDLGNDSSVSAGLHVFLLWVCCTDLGDAYR